MPSRFIIQKQQKYVQKFQFHARAAPSAGLLTMFQSYICNIQNECNKYEDFEVKFNQNVLKSTKFIILGYTKLPWFKAQNNGETSRTYHLQ